MALRSLPPLLVLTFAQMTVGLDVYYMDSICGQSIDMTEIHSASVETSKTLTYPNNLDCTVTFQAPAGKRFYLILSRFVTELSGNRCYDHLSIYDGASVTSPTIADKLCGEITGEPVYNTSAEFVTFKFVSDDSAKDRGFAIVVLGFTEGPTCNSDELLCQDRQICIDEVDSLCDGYDHCGDNSDESQCGSGTDSENSSLVTSIGLIVGLSIVGVTLVIIVIFMIHYCYKKYKWNQYLKQLYGNKNVLVSAKIEAAYPLTHNYQDKEFINITRAERDAALVKIDDGGAAANPDIPYGSSASLASSQISMDRQDLQVNTNGAERLNPTKDDRADKVMADDEKTTLQASNEGGEDMTTENSEKTPDSSAGVDNSAFVDQADNGKVTEL